MYSSKSFQELLSKFDWSTEDNVITLSIMQFCNGAGYSVSSVEKFLELDKTRFFRINFEHEKTAILFISAYDLAVDKGHPLQLGFKTVSIVVL